MLGPRGQHLMKPAEVVTGLELFQLLKGNLPPHNFRRTNNLAGLGCMLDGRSLLFLTFNGVAQDV